MEKTIVLTVDQKNLRELHKERTAAKEGKTLSMTVNVAFFCEIKVLKSGGRGKRHRIQGV